ncbi:adenylyl-sulfate kinase [Marinobacter vulgaris]|nr:adenylyl-sulfate kinase [Marinobacter vulgaris]
MSGPVNSTTANTLDMALHQRRHHTFLLNGDNVRHGLNRVLGFQTKIV